MTIVSHLTRALRPCIPTFIRITLTRYSTYSKSPPIWWRLLTRSVTRAPSILLSSTDIIFTSQTIVNIIEANVTIHNVVLVPLLKTDTITYIYNKTWLSYIYIYIYIRFSVFRTADDHAERLFLFTSTRVTLWFERAMFTNVGRTSGLALILLLYYHIVIGFPDILPHYWRLLCHRYGTIDCIIAGNVQVSFSRIIIITIVINNMQKYL